MSRQFITSFVILSGILTFVVFINTHAQNDQTDQTVIVPAPTATVVTPSAPVATEIVVTPPSTSAQTIVTEVPKPKEVVTIPTGYVNCFSVGSGWYKDRWIASHQICQYENMPDKAAWVEGYWACTQYKRSEGICTQWDWVSAHWAKSLVVY